MRYLILFALLFSAIGFSKSSRNLGERPAPSGPGNNGYWSTPQKQAFMTSLSQNFWGTVGDGILNEVYYPTVDRAQTKDTQMFFLLDDGSLLQESKDFNHKVERIPGSLAFKVKSDSHTGGIHIEKTLVADPSNPLIRIYYHIVFTKREAVKVYVIHNPAADNTHGGDGIYVGRGDKGTSHIIAFQADRRGDEHPDFKDLVIQALVIDKDGTDFTAGFEGVNGPWEQLSSAKGFKFDYDSAYYGNVAAGIEVVPNNLVLNLNLALGFEKDTGQGHELLLQKLRTALETPVADAIDSHVKDWKPYLASLNEVGRKNESHVLNLKALEDKTYRGAIIAAPSLPWLPDRETAPEYEYELARRRQGDSNGGYHRVWPRDLYQMALGLLAAGDTKTVVDVLKYLKNIQLDDGTFAQNMWVDGSISWGAYQSDETAYPIILTARLAELNLIKYEDYRVMVILAGRYLVRQGPWTSQERWEETSGFSPNSIAATTQALFDAAWLESSFHTTDVRIFRDTATFWRDQIYNWTLVKKGVWGENYFERMELGKQGDEKRGRLDPDLPAKFTIANNPIGGSDYLETEIIDGGFLQWVFAGLLKPNDPRITSSIKVYDRVVGVTLPEGFGYMRYNHDAYGLGHVGKVWPLLSGERALSSIERGEDPSQHVRFLESHVEPSGVLCEQVGLSACPLGWAHAEVLILNRSLKDGKSFYIPGRSEDPYQRQ